MTTVTPMRWTGDALELLDQRRLPVDEVWVACRDWRAVAEAIVEMVVRGAPAIGITAAYGVVLAARAAGPGATLADLEPALAGLAATRPTAVNLFWALDRMRARGAVSASLADDLEAEATAIHDEDRRMCSAMGDHGAALLPDAARVLTHCNTGALATGGDGTALAVIRSAWRQGRVARIYADETRPFLQGSRLTAWELQRDGIPTRVITDSMAAHLMQRGEIDAVVVGTDRVAANGDVANKIGTYGVAVLCAHHGLPFYVVGPTSTIDLGTASGADIPIERRPAREVTHVGERRVVPEGVEVENPAFDVTPAALVTAIVTEQGVARPPYATSLAAHVAAAGATRLGPPPDP